MGVEGTIVVEFGEGVDNTELVVVELDGHVNKDAGGKEKTSFNPDDTPGFILHYDETKLRIDRVECSSGSISGGSLVTRTRTRQMQFTNTDDSQDLAHIPDGSLSWNWRRSGTAVSSGERVNSPNIVQDRRKLRAAGPVPAIGEATYTIRCNAYQFTPPDLTLDPNDTWEVLIAVYMETA